MLVVLRQAQIRYLGTARMIYAEEGVRLCVNCEEVFAPVCCYVGFEDHFMIFVCSYLLNIHLLETDSECKQVNTNNNLILTLANAYKETCEFGKYAKYKNIKGT